MKFGVVMFPGSNCDHDTYHVISKVIGQPVDFLWHRQNTVADCDAVYCRAGSRTATISGPAPSRDSAR